MPIERPDWDEPTDVPAPAPQKSQSISRPDWTAPADDVPVPVEGRPDWNESDLPVEVSKSETHPDWPIEVDESAEEAQEHLVAAEPEEVTPLVDNMIAELAETGEHDLSVAHEAIEATLEAVPAWDRAEFESDFESLPPGAQKAIVGELASPRNEWEGLAGEDELENFASTTEGAELVSEWGDEADINLARVQARLTRIEANTSPAAIDEMWDWFDGLPSAQAKVVLQVLAE